MIEIVTDTSALFTVEEGLKLGVHVIPLCVSINGKHYRDLSFATSEFIQDIEAGGIPSTSQPPIGDVLVAYEDFSGNEILNLCMADGLSGTYQTAMMAREQALNKDDITVINTKTLCGPHRYLVEKAVTLRKAGKTMTEIVHELEESIAQEHSFLIPQDFSFLKRGGRLKPAAASIGGLLKLKPIMEAVDNGSRLDKFSIARTLGKAADMIGKYFHEHGVDQGYKVFISHAHALQDALFIQKRLQTVVPDADYEMLELSQAFITQGGPQCIAVQYIKK